MSFSPKCFANNCSARIVTIGIVVVAKCVL